MGSDIPVFREIGGEFMAYFDLADPQSLANLVARMDVLVGDTTADRSVNSADISQTKSQSGHPVTGSNFRQDVTADVVSGSLASIVTVS